MKETEQFNGPLAYRDAMPMLNEEARPVSEGDLDTLVGSMSLWYDDFYHFHKALVEKYG